MTKNGLAWIGDGAPRMEVAHVAQIDPTFAASGTQLGATYELRYLLGPETLCLELVGLSIVERGRWDGDQVVVPCGLGRVDLCG